MKNIFSLTGYSADSVGNFTSITTNGINIPGSQQGDILIIGDTKGNVEGLNIGAQNHVLVANPTNNGLPGYTNAININTVTCNDLMINGLKTGDLIVGQTNNYVQRLPIGALGNLLHSDGTNVYWGPLVFPDPLTLQDLILSNSLKLSWR